MATKNGKLQLFTACLTGVVAIAVALIEFQPWKKPIMPFEERTLPSSTFKKALLSGAIVDEDTNNSISQAEISIVGKNDHYYSERNGNFKINISVIDSIPTVRIRVSKSGYHTSDISYDLPTEGVIIQLSKINRR